MASVLRLGDGFPAGLYDRIGPEDHQRAGASFLGPRLSQAAPAWSSRTTVQTRRGQQAPGLVISDDRPGAPAENIFWAGNLGEAGAVWYAYQSAWLPASLLETDRRESLADALFEAAKHRGVALHFNKGIAGATAEAIAATKDTAMNPAVVDAFALAITGDFGQPAYPGVPGHEPDAAAARTQAEAVDKSMDAIRKLLPRVGSYVWETDLLPAALAGGVLGRKLRPASRGQE